jgi:succinoglycan biosynthesis protein ExoV
VRLYYFKRQDQRLNFGDDLNDWLWERLLPGCFQENSDIVFVGMGTLINHKLPKRLGDARQVVVFSTGVGYESPLSDLPSHWQIYCLRGPLSAERLGLPRQFAITDGAALIRRCYTSSPRKESQVAFMPHISHAAWGGEIWQRICQALGFRYIDPRGTVDETLAAISETELLIAEAMHGAITADALRVPWIPVTTSPRILAFKWQDWCASVGVSYHPKFISPLPQVYPRLAHRNKASRRSLEYWQLLSQSVSHCQNWVLQHPTSVPKLLLGQAEEAIAIQLQQIATQPPVLSEDESIERLTTRLEERLFQLKLDWA